MLWVSELAGVGDWNRPRAFHLQSYCYFLGRLALLQGRGPGHLNHKTNELNAPPEIEPSVRSSRLQGKSLKINSKAFSFKKKKKSSEPVAFLLYFLLVHSYASTVRPPARGLGDTQKLQEEPRDDPSVKTLKGPGQVWGAGERDGGAWLLQKGSTARRSLAPFPAGEGATGWKGLEGKKER